MYTDHITHKIFSGPPARTENKLSLHHGICGPRCKEVQGKDVKTELAFSCLKNSKTRIKTEKHPRSNQGGLQNVSEIIGSIYDYNYTRDKVIETEL